MSYDLRLIDKKTKKTLQLKEKHNLKGGTYEIGGTSYAWLNVTYNYSSFFYQIFGEKGIRTLYGMNGKDSISVLEDGISKLGDDVSDDYWKATEGNAKSALKNLLILAKACPDGVWEGD